MKKFLGILLVIILLLFGFYSFLKDYDENNKSKENQTIEEQEKLKDLEEQQVRYESCMKNHINSSLLGDNFNNKVIEVDNFLKNYQLQ